MRLSLNPLLLPSRHTPLISLLSFLYLVEVAAGPKHEVAEGAVAPVVEGFSEVVGRAEEGRSAWKRGDV